MLLAATALLGACSSGETGSSNGSTTSADVGATTGSSGTGPQPSSSARPDVDTAPTGTIVFARTGTIENLDPVSVSAVFAFAAQPVYDPLIWERADQALEPGLAKTWQLDEDGLTLTLTLQEGVQFSDGTPFNADAVRANFERAKTVTTSPYRATLYDKLGEIEVVDDSTVVIHMTEVIPDILLQLARPQGWMISPSILDAPDIDQNPVGTGPWVLNRKESIPGVHYVYDANPTHWNPQWQRVQRVEMRLLESREAVLNAAIAGEVDVVDTLKGPEADAASAAGLNVQSSAATNSYFLWILDHAGKVQPALGKLKARQAMAAAIDIDGYIDGVLAGDGIASNQLAWPGNSSYIADFDPAYEYDPAHAKELLTTAGVPDGFTCQGYIMQGHPLGTWQEGVAQMLGDVGIKMDLKPIDVANYFSEARSGNYTCLGMNAGWRDPAEFFASYLSVPKLNEVFGPMDEDIVALADQGASTFDDVARGKAYQEMFRLMIERGYVIPMYRSENHAAFADGVEGVEFKGTFQQPWDPRGVSVAG